MQANFKETLCQQQHLPEDRFVPYVLRRCLFTRFLIVSPFMRLLMPNLLFNEERLIERVGKANTLREVQEEVDFYQHKYVVDSILKDALKFRLSGMRLMRLANREFATRPGASAKREPKEKRPA